MAIGRKDFDHPRNGKWNLAQLLRSVGSREDDAVSTNIALHSQRGISNNYRQASDPER